MCDFPFKKRIKSVGDLELIINQVREYRGISKITELYRGQGRDCWKLEPKISRNIKDPKELRLMEENIIKNFLHLIREKGLLDSISEGRKIGEFELDWLLIQQAQHFGLPTRFMDWSGRWEISLYFAVSNKKYDSIDGQFWIYFVPERNWVSDNGDSNYQSESPFEYKQTIFLNSAYIFSENAQIQISQRRKGIQMGRFCIQPYSKIVIPLEEQEEHKPYLHKIIIPAKFKKTIREDLKLQGITKDAIYVSEPINPRHKVKHKKSADAIDKIVKQLSQKYGF